MKPKEKIATQKSTKVIGKIQELSEDVEEHEVAAQISVPHEGGWGWVVVCCAFFSIFILDGVAFTIGSMLTDIAKDFKVTDSLIALMNSTAVSLYFMGGPLASALINRFGFRECAMSGSVICSISMLSTYFAKTYTGMFVFYGFFAGFGFCLINMSSSLIVGFYFERLRSVALAISSCGSSIGVMSLFPTNAYLVKLAGWRPTVLLHSGLFGTIFFLGMSYRPLLSLIVANKEEEPTRTVIYLPSTTGVSTVSHTSGRTGPTPTTPPISGKRMFSAVSNVNFPTAAAVVADATNLTTTGSQAGPSTTAKQKESKLTYTPLDLEGAISQRQLKQVQSNMSGSEGKKVELKIPEAQPKKSFWERLFNWEPQSGQARPLYRDDAFYEGKLEDLPEYQKSVMDTSKDARTGLEYQMAVTRAVAVDDLHERRGLFTTAIRRVLATMMDPTLLRRKSFLLLCCSGFFTYLGFLVPYVYLRERNLNAGINSMHCNLFISAIGMSNAVGRISMGALATKIDPLKLFSFWCIAAGLSTILSSLSFNVYYQYVYCFVFGFSIACVPSLRSVIIVKLYGLNNLTNATGVMLIFLGLGNIMSTPLAGLIKDSFGFAPAFYVAGFFIFMSGVVLIPAKMVANKELLAIPTQEFRNKQAEKTR